MKKTVLTTGTGFSLDYTNCFCSQLTLQDIESLQHDLQRAHTAIEKMRSTGEVNGHLSKDGTPEKVLFTELPYLQEGNLNSVSTISRIQEYGQSLRYSADAVVFFGIGGSYLGNKVLFDIECGEFWNAKSVKARNGYPKIYFSGNNIDPRRTDELINQLIADANCFRLASQSRNYKIVLVVISKSGSTLDTMSTFMVAYEHLLHANEVDIEVVAVTDPAEGDRATLLGKLAKEKGWITFAIPDGIGGRFSVFSELGLLAGACFGVDIEAFLAGARAMDECCRTGTVWENPAMLNAAIKYTFAKKYGRTIEVFMPYADYLKSAAEWYIQLLAESLGKRYDRNGQIVYYGRTPVVGVGTTDMHSQTQLHQDGPQDKVIQFVRVGKWKHDPVIPNSFPQVATLANMANIRLSQALDAALEANAEALASDSRPSLCITLPEMTPFHLGELLYMLALSIAYEGELANVDAFDQPGVEAYKKILGPRLATLKHTK